MIGEIVILGLILSTDSTICPFKRPNSLLERIVSYMYTLWPYC